jgi:hypothetical protein
MRSIVTLGLCIGIFHCFGQDVEPTVGTQDSEQDSVRAYYVKSFPDHFFLYPVLKQRSLSFQLEKRGTNGELVTYKPNTSYSFGVGTYLFELGFELTFAIPLDQKELEIYGQSKARDLQLNVLGKQFGVDAFYQKYNGFYVTDSKVTIPADVAYPQRPDVSSKNTGITGNYVFNNKRFSFRSAYNFAERQVFSKGSFLLFTSISSFKLSADSSIINKSQRSIFSDELTFTKLKYATFGIAPGYTYSIVFKNFFLNGTLSVGPAHHWITYRLEGGNDQHETAINSFVAVRLALGYNGERFFGGISFLSQGSNVKFKETTFSNNNGAFKILVGYRFREFGILSKRVWDLIPFKI